MAEKKASNSILDMIRGNRTVSRDSPAVLPGITTAVATPATAAPQIHESEESLVERVLKSRAHVKPEEAKEDLAALQGLLQGLSKKTVVVVFALGKLLTEVKAELPHGEFIPWIEENCNFSRWSATLYMRVYNRYKNEPRRALEELSISEAYIEAGIKRLAVPKPEPVHRYGGDAPTAEELDIPTADDFKRIFSQGTMSGVTLKRHRVVPYRDGSIYVVRPETGPLKACDLYIDMSIMDPSYQDAVQEVHHNLCMALEVFYSKMEACEDRGIINAPFDSSRPAMARRMRNVSPETKPKKASKGGSK
jgi:hypothetical protein